jgi:predicted nucleic-acid-binding protein
VRLATDTDLLVRIVTQDDAAQSRIAFELLSAAEQVVVSLPCLCEFVWVLRSVYGFKSRDLEAAVRSVTDPGNVMTDRVAIDAGLRMQATGGDFADGVIASIGIAMGADAFVSFDRKAIARLGSMGIAAHHAGELA